MTLALAALLVLTGAAALTAGRVWRVVHPRRSAVRGGPSRFGLPCRGFRAVTGDGKRLVGWFVPAPDPRGLFVLCHNLGSHKGRLLPVARVLHRAGYSVALFDFRGHGESQGHGRVLTPFRVYAEDLRAVLDELRAAGAVPSRGLVVAGYSLGTVAALLCGASDPDVRGLVLDSGPAFSVVRDSDRRFRAAFRLPRFPFRWLALPLVRALSGEGRLRGELLGAASRLGERPLLMIWGERDEIVSRADVERLFAAARSERKELWVVPHAHHMTGFAVDRDAYAGRLLAFASAALGANSGAEEAGVG